MPATRHPWSGPGILFPHSLYVLRIKTEEQKNIRMQMMPIRQSMHKQAPACHCLMFIKQAKLVFTI